MRKVATSLIGSKRLWSLQKLTGRYPFAVVVPRARPVVTQKVPRALPKLPTSERQQLLVYLGWIFMLDDEHVPVCHLPTILSKANHPLLPSLP